MFGGNLGKLLRLTCVTVSFFFVLFIAIIHVGGGKGALARGSEVFKLICYR